MLSDNPGSTVDQTSHLYWEVCLLSWWLSSTKTSWDLEITFIIPPPSWTGNRSLRGIPGHNNWYPKYAREGTLKRVDTREVSVCSALHISFSGDTEQSAQGWWKGLQPLHERLIDSYSSWRKSRKWYLTVLRHFVGIAVTNSCLLHKTLCGELGAEADDAPGLLGASGSKNRHIIEI